MFRLRLYPVVNDDHGIGAHLDTQKKTAFLSDHTEHLTLAHGISR